MSIYLDIKQTEISAVDYQRRYLKLLYTNNEKVLEKYLQDISVSITTNFEPEYLTNKDIARPMKSLNYRSAIRFY